MRLIDADALGVTDFELVLCDGDYKELCKTLIAKVESAPIIDAVHVVRCDECWFRPKGKTYCIELERHTGDGFYCAFGQRREDGEA